MVRCHALLFVGRECVDRVYVVCIGYKAGLLSLIQSCNTSIDLYSFADATEHWSLLAVLPHPCPMTEAGIPGRMIE